MKGQYGMGRRWRSALALLLLFCLLPAQAGTEAFTSDWLHTNVTLAPAEYAYQFHGVGDRALVSYVLGLNGVYSGVTDVTVSDPGLVAIDEDLYLEALDWFDLVTLTVETVTGDVLEIALSNPRPVTALPADAVTVGPADVSAAAEALGITPQTLPGGNAADFVSTGWLGLDLAVAPERLTPGTYYRTEVRLDAPVALAEADAVITARTLTLYHIVDGEPSPVDQVEFDVRGNALYGFTMTTDGFSPYMVAWTVDFHYRGTDYSIPGESQILLSELIRLLDIRTDGGELLDVREVATVRFTDDRLVTVTPVSGYITCNGHPDVYVGEKDFLLTSQTAFTSQEALTLVTQDGTRYLIGVTDAPYTITFSAGEGGYVVNGEGTYTIDDAAYINNNVTAVPQDGYRFVEWLNGDGSHYSYEPHMRIYADQITGNTHYRAVFEEVTQVTIYYQANQVRGTVSIDSEIADKRVGAAGCTATAKRNYRFVSWMDEKGTTVGYWPEFVPAGEQIREGATYTAVFEPDIYDSYLTIGVANVDETEPGYVGSATYDNTVNGHVVAMYIREDGTIPADLIAQAYEEFVFDHWELNWNRLPVAGNTIPAGYDLSAYIQDGANYLIAYYTNNPDVPVHRIYYVAEPAAGGTVTRSMDEWRGSNTKTVYGSTARANANYAFAGWIEKTDDPNVVIPIQGYDWPTLAPEGELLKDATYYAMFRKTGAQSGMVGYNMNLYDTAVSWGGAKDFVMMSGVGAVMYYSTKGGQYYARGEKFYLDTHTPQAEGYKFLGWFDKDRPEFKHNGVTYPALPGRLLPAGYNEELVFRFNGDTGGRYTVEAVWAGIYGESKRLPYDGNTHLLEANAVLEKGTLYDTPRYRQELEQILADGGYSLGEVQYRLVSVDGVPVQSGWEDSFSRKMPGRYTVIARANGTFLGSPFTLEKELTLEIYGAKVIINKVWVDDNNVTGNRPEDLDVSLNRGAIAGEPAQTDMSGYAAGDGVSPAEAEPDWTKAANTWSETYGLVLVRPHDFDEKDQDSGYYPYRAEEIVPKGYAFAGMQRVVSEDRLTTTITFTNEIQKTSLVLNKLDEAGGILDGAEFTVSMVKNIYEQAPPEPYSVTFTAGTRSEDLPNGYYVLTETKAPDGAQGLLAPIYFTVFNGAGYSEDEKGLRLTDETWTRPGSYEGVVLSGSGELYVMAVENDWQRVSVPVGGVKELRGKALEAEQFTFELLPAESGVSHYPGLGGRDLLEATHDARGRFAFSLEYAYPEYLAWADAQTGVAELRYLVRERLPATADSDGYDPESGIYYSRRQYRVTVSLGMVDGVLTVLGKEIE